MGRLVNTIIACWALSVSVYADLMAYNGIRLGSYIDVVDLKEIDRKGTTSDGYLCYRTSKNFVLLSFDRLEDKARFTAVSEYFDKGFSSDLNCIENTEVEPVVKGVTGLNELLAYLEESDFSSMPARKSNHYLYSKPTYRGEECIDVNDEFEGSYSFLAHVVRELRVDIAFEEDNILYVARSLTEKTDLKKSFTDQGCMDLK